MKPSRTQIKQPRSDEVRDTILNFIRTHFYQGQYVNFVKHRRHLLQWVVFRLAVYLDSKSVTIPPQRYIEIMCVKPGILMEALRFGNTGNITYLPAWLGKCVQSHLAVHGENYYEEGKTLRNTLDATLKFAQKQVSTITPDATRELAAAARLLKGPKRVVKKPLNQQRDLL